MNVNRSWYFSLLFLFLALITVGTLLGQNAKASLSGTVKDASGAVLQGARITLEPAVQPQASDDQGEFHFNSLAPGAYKVSVSFVGFDAFTKQVTVAAGQTIQIDAVLKVASNVDEVVVTAERPRGEAAAINRTLAAENIVQVLPAEVITSLPNANIADALGRMASVTIERDEGEGKYVQIRGTEPRLSNTMVDGVTVPSPESGVRQIKLDTIASDLVESVEINKTLQANIDADGIGGSVNLVTKTASDTPSATLYGIGGYTPIIGGRTVDQMGGTIGKRFGASKKLGVLIGGTYDFNGRGINDIEPSPTTSSLTPHYDSMDIRDYIYYRTRWGATASLGLQVERRLRHLPARPVLHFPQLGQQVGLHNERRRRSAIQSGLAPTQHGGRQPLPARQAQLQRQHHPLERRRRPFAVALRQRQRQVYLGGRS